MDTVLYYAELIGRLIAIGVSVFSIVYAIINLTKAYAEKLKLAIDNKDWELMLNIIGEFVTAAEEKFIGKEGAGAEKKEMVVSLLQEAGYEVTKIVDALIESAVYQKFNSGTEKK